jgi:hypothetical protein
MWKEAVMAYLMAKSQPLLGEQKTARNHSYFARNSRCLQYSLGTDEPISAQAVNINLCVSVHRTKRWCDWYSCCV